MSVEISGTISYCSNPVPGPVRDVMLTLTGNASTSVVTDDSGGYRFSFLPAGGSYTVVPSKAALMPTSSSINTADMIAIHRHIFQITPIPPGCRLAAADVTGDGVVDTFDIVAIQRFYLGRTTGIANVGKYQFTPVNRSYPGILSDQTAQDYETLVFGDVAPPFAEPSNGQVSSAADKSLSVSAPAAGVEISLPRIDVEISGSSFIAPVTTTAINAGDKLVGFQGDLTFDERVFTFQDQPVRQAGLTAGNWNVSGNVLPRSGPIRTLRISALSKDFTALSGSGTLFELRMAHVGKKAQHTQLIWAEPPDHFVFVDADLTTQKPGAAAPGSITTLGKRK